MNMGFIFIPENTTNGAILKEAFPNMKIIYEKPSITIMEYEIDGRKECIVFSTEWWNAPYTREVEE